MAEVGATHGDISTFNNVDGYFEAMFRGFRFDILKPEDYQGGEVGAEGWRPWTTVFRNQGRLTGGFSVRFVPVVPVVLPVLVPQLQSKNSAESNSTDKNVTGGTRD